MEKEIWKSVPNYIGYEVSSLGRVRSLDREVAYSDGRVRRCKGKVLKQNPVGKGYLKVCINTTKGMYVHQLVAMAFLGHVPNGQKLVVDHIDGDKLNNNLNNLQVITNRENTSKDRSGGTSKYVGVSWSKQNKKWKAQIRVDGKQIYIGHFTNEIDAHNAYQKKLKEISK